MKLKAKHTIFFLISLIVFIFAPIEFDRNYNYVCFALYIIFLYIFLKDTTNKNFFNFNVLFFLSFSFTNFVYPCFYHNTDTFLVVISNRYFNENVINRSTGLSLLAYSSYSLGYVINYKSIKRINIKRKINLNIINIVIVISSILFLMTIDKRFLLGVNVGMTSWSPLAMYSYILFTNASILFFVKHIYNLLNNEKFLVDRKDIFILFIILLIFGIVLRAGERGMPLQFIIIFGFIYSIYKKGISLKKISLFAILGFIFFTIISYTRVNDVSESTKTFTYDEMVVGVDLMVANRNLFLAYDYILNKDINLGSTMLSQLFRPIPIFPSYIFEINNIKMYKTDSVHFFNFLTYGEFKPASRAGVGTSLIGDILISFGIVGVILLMFLFGLFIQKLSFESQKLNNINYLLIYVIVLSLSIYLPRAGYFYILQPIVWIYILFKINKLLKI